MSNEPIIIRGEWVGELCSYMYMSSEMSGQETERIESQTIIKTLVAYLKLYSKAPEIEELSFRESGKSPAKLTFALAPDECIDMLQARREKEAGTAFFERRPRILSKGQHASLTCETCERWSLAATAIKRHPQAIDEMVLATHEVDGRECRHFKAQQLVAERIQNWPGDDLLRKVGGLVVGMILWLANLFYGGIHAAAWNNHFPSTAEKWIWRGSALYIGFCGGLWVVLNYIVASYTPLNEFWESWMDGKKRWWHNIILGTLVFVCGLSLVLARAYIVIEAFVSIRELPAMAYDTPSWAQVFPHF